MPILNTLARENAEKDERIVELEDAITHALFLGGEEDLLRAVAVLEAALEEK